MSDVLQWCGYKGWVILIDELELIARLGKVGRMQAYINLNWLLNWSGNMNFSIYCLGVVATPLEDKWKGSYDSRYEADRDSIPVLASQKFDDNTDEELKNFFQHGLDFERSLKIEKLEKQQLINVLNKVAEFHGISYQWTPKVNIHELVDQLGANPIRTYIRALLESLDIEYLYSEDYIPNAVNLEEISLTEENDFFAEE
jgi:hypothetical protein